MSQKFTSSLKRENILWANILNRIIIFRGWHFLSMKNIHLYHWNLSDCVEIFCVTSLLLCFSIEYQIIYSIFPFSRYIFRSLIFFYCISFPCVKLSISLSCDRKVIGYDEKKITKTRIKKRFNQKKRMCEIVIEWILSFN